MFTPHGFTVVENEIQMGDCSTQRQSPQSHTVPQSIVIVIVIVNTTIYIAPSVASYFKDALQDC